MISTDNNWQIKMLYDCKCPVCSREVALLRKRNFRGLIAFEDIALPEFDAGKYGLTTRQVVGATHAVRPDGSIVRGIDVFAEVYEAVGLTWLARPIRWWVTRPLAKCGYWIFAAVRPWLSSFRPAECADACRPPASRRTAPVVLLILGAAWFGGCGASNSAPVATGRANPPALVQSKPATPDTLPATTEDSEMEKPFMIEEAHLPEGFPLPGPVDEVIIKQYPKCRAALVQATAVDGGENKMFGSLFKHIKSNNIAMSAPVDITWSDTDPVPRETAMAFIYGDPTVGKTGPDGVVEVVDLPAQTMLSIGVRGSYSKKNLSAGLMQLKSWLAKHSQEYRVAGPPRYLGYNSPFVPWFMKFGEVQLPVAAVH